MTTRYIRVRDRRTGHEYDVLEEQVNDTKHEVLKRFEPSSRPRAAKPLISKGGGSTQPGPRDGDLSERNTLPELQNAARDAGIDPGDLTKKQILAALKPAKTSTD